jgi:dethiobiotin synthetase
VVLGTAPGAGQTVLATALVRALCRQGVRAVGMQPVARGVSAGGSWVPGDELQRLAAAGAPALPARALVPALLSPAVMPMPAGLPNLSPAGLPGALPAVLPERSPATSPHHSAQPLPTLDDVIERFRILATWADAVIVDDSERSRAGLALDFGPLAMASRLRLPAVLVVPLSAGCVDQTQARLAQLRDHGVDCVAWVANDAVGEARPDRWLDALRAGLPGHALGVIPRLSPSRIDAAADALDLPRVLHALAA